MRADSPQNHRALYSHNPYQFKARVIGDYALNQTPPPVFIAGDDVGALPGK